MRTPLVIALLMLLMTGVGAQTIVSTAVQNRHVVLEEYGGIYCVYCPEGNSIAANIRNNHPEEVVLINIHEGPYANPLTGGPDFRTDFGESLANQTALTGYPAGTINRRVFPGYEQGPPNTTALSRTYWSWASENILAEVSPVNLGATASLDLTTGEMTIYVEIYYTGNSVTSTNRLNIALLQNEVLGPQVGGGAGNEYVHNRLLRDMVTGQWGDAINTTTAGHFEARTITYALPSAVRGIPIDPSKLELAIFITEGHQKVLTGIHIQPTYVVPYDHDGNALFASSDPVVCGDVLTPSVIIRNDGHESLTTLTISYQVNGGLTADYVWNGNLATFESESIVLPAVNFIPNVGGSNTLEITVSNPNNNPDGGEANNYVSSTFDSAPQTNTQMVELKLRTDNFGYETYWECINDAGTVIASGGNMTVGATNGGQQIAQPGNPGAYGNNQNISQWITLPGPGCYELRVLDDYGDGICCDYGLGFYELKNASGQSLFSGGIFTSEKIEPFQLDYSIATASAELQTSEAISIYPNPIRTGEDLQVQTALNQAEKIRFTLFSLDGKKVADLGERMLPEGEQELSFQLPRLASGIYLLQLQSTMQRQVIRVIVME